MRAHRLDRTPLTTNTITVSIPYFRCRQYVRRCVDSVLAQSYKDFRVIVINDGDAKAPWDVLADIDDPRLVRFDLEENRGYFLAHAVVLNATHGDYFVIQDPDDWSSPERIEKLLDAARRGEAKAAFSDIWHYIEVDGATASVLETHPDWQLPLAPGFKYRASASGLYHTGLLRSIDAFQTTLPVAYDKLLVPLAMMAAPATYVHEGLYHRLIRDGSLTTNVSTGLRSRTSRRANRQIESIYRSAYDYYSAFEAGRISRDEVAQGLRSILSPLINSDQRNAVLKESERLRRVLENPTSAPPTVVSMPVQPPKEPPDPQKYRHVAFNVFPYSEGEKLVQCTESGEARVMPAKEFALLSNARTFASVQQHALDRFRDERRKELERPSAVLWRKLKWRFAGRSKSHLDHYRELFAIDPERIAAAGREIEDLIDLGLLVSDVEIAERCRQVAERASPAPQIAALTIATRNRPEAVGRAVESYAKNFEEYDRNVGIVVLDTSHRSEDRSRTQTLLASLAAGQSRGFHYAGPDQINRYCTELAQQADLPIDLVRFALSGSDEEISTGASRNALLLDTAGEMILQVDDDSVCQLMPPPNSGDDLVLSESEDPTDFWFFRSRDEAFALCEFQSAGIGGLHEQRLGRLVAECVDSNGAGAREALHGWPPTQDHLLGSETARVRVTTAGMVGDSGVGSSGYFFLPPESRRRLPVDEEDFRAIVQSRQVFRSASQPTLVNRAGLMSFHLGLDNRDPLPPFLPVGRGSDAVFSFALPVWAPESCLVFLPWAVRHEPVEARTQSFEQIWKDLEGVSLSSLLVHLIRSWENQARLPTRLGLARHLQDLGALPASEFENYLRTDIWREFSWKVETLEQALASTAGASGYLLRYQKQYVQTIREAMVRPDFVIPSELTERYGRDRARTATQGFVARYGELLEHWPSMFEAARALAKKGMRVSEPVSGN